MLSWLWKETIASEVPGPVDPKYEAFQRLCDKHWYGEGTTATPPEPSKTLPEGIAWSSPQQIPDIDKVAPEGG